MESVGFVEYWGNIKSVGNCVPTLLNYTYACNALSPPYLLTSFFSIDHYFNVIVTPCGRISTISNSCDDAWNPCHCMDMMDVV